MKTYNIRKVELFDIDALYNVARKMPAYNEDKYFEKCLAEMQGGKREIFVASSIDDGRDLLGYIQLIWSPLYVPFKRMDIPEIQDLNVIPSARRMGIGADLVETCEQEVLNSGRDTVGIGVGLDASFGSAQRLYIKRGYIPDGLGVCYDEEPVRAGAIKPVDDLFSLKLTKELKQ